jgi:hypothetical protein
MRHEVVKYRDYARECLRQAEQADTPERRDKLIELARIWAEAAQVLDAAPHPDTSPWGKSQT